MPLHPHPEDGGRLHILHRIIDAAVDLRAHHLVESGARDGNILERRVEVQEMTVAQDQAVIRAIQQKALRETLDHRLAGARFVQDDAGPQHRAIRLALGPGDRVSVFLAAVAGDDGRLDVPGGEGFRSREQPFSELCLVFIAVATEQRLGIR